MSADMTVDIFAKQVYGKIALQKFGNVPENFRLYEAGWLNNGEEYDVMKVSGAEFRKAKSGPNKGKLCILIKGTSRFCYITTKEINDYKRKEAIENVFNKLTSMSTEQFKIVIEKHKNSKTGKAIYYGMFPEEYLNNEDVK